jgi:hypothetical protein
MQPDQLTEMTRGDTPPWDLVVTDADGAPFDLTGWTIYFTAKRRVDDTDPGVFQLSTTAGTISITNAAQGEATIRPLRASTNGLADEPTLFWDVQLSRAGTPDLTYTVAIGQLLIRKDITRQP